MPNPTDVSVRGESRSGGDLDSLRDEFNRLVTNLRVLTAKLDADATVTDTNYAALVTDSAASGPAKVVAIFG